MEFEVSAEAKDKRLNRRVALTVVVLSVFMGLGNIKDGNIVQAMQQAQSDAVDDWNEYQATRTKAHIARTAQAEIAVLAPHADASGSGRGMVGDLDREVRKYTAEAPRLAASAKAAAARYDALNVHDDQFDASEALISTAVSVAAVSALAESGWLLIVAWVFGALGMFMGVCGFAGLNFDPHVLSTLLG